MKRPTRLTIEIPKEFRSEVKKYAIAKGMSLKGVVLNLLQTWLKEQKQTP